MLIAYVELEKHTYYHVAEVDGLHLAQQGDDIMFREVRYHFTESVPVDVHDNRFVAHETVRLNPPKVEICSEHPVADWFEVPADKVNDKHVYPYADIAQYRQ
jgi:hypothetical protein